MFERIRKIVGVVWRRNDHRMRYDSDSKRQHVCKVQHSHSSHCMHDDHIEYHASQTAEYATTADELATNKCSELHEYNAENAVRLSTRNMRKEAKFEKCNNMLTSTFTKNTARASDETKRKHLRTKTKIQV